MKSYRINNVKVTESSNGTKCVTLNQNNLENCFKLINDYGIKEVEISDNFDKYKDLSFLNECPNIESLSIENHHIKDISYIYNLKKLHTFGIDEPYIAIDFERLKGLKSLHLTWHKKVQGLNNLENLKELYIWNYVPASRDFTEISNLINLEDLVITQAKIDSLNGISNLKRLKNLQLNLSRLLTDIDDVALVTSLETLEIEGCKNIKDFTMLSNLKQLKVLDLFKCGEIQSIKFVEELSNLKVFSFYNTNVIDGDISPCVGIEEVYFSNKKHYSHKEADFTHAN